MSIEGNIAGGIMDKRASNSMDSKAKHITNKLTNHTTTNPTLPNKSPTSTPPVESQWTGYKTSYLTSTITTSLAKPKGMHNSQSTTQSKVDRLTVMVNMRVVSTSTRWESLDCRIMKIRRINLRWKGHMFSSSLSMSITQHIRKTRFNWKTISVIL